MMSTVELPEILPESFNHPLNSYDENTDNFINEVVKVCHSSLHSSIYDETGFYNENTESFDTPSNHHSLLLDEKNQLLQGSLRTNGRSRTSSCRSSYSCEQNVQVGGNRIQLLVREATESFPALTDHNLDNATHLRCDHHLVEDVSASDTMGGVQVRIECTDSQETSPSRTRRKGLHNLSQELLRPAAQYSIISPSETPSDSSSCTTPTQDLVSPPSIEYPGSEEKPCVLRGQEVAKLDEECPGSDFKPRVDYSAVHFGMDNEMEEFHDGSGSDGAFGSKRLLTNGHSRLDQALLPFLLRRRTHLSHHKPNQSTDILPLPTPETRKLSDPAIQLRRHKIQTTSEPRRQRCKSDSEPPNLQLLLDDDELKSEGCSSVLDSGFHDERSSRYQENTNTYYSSPRVSLYSSDLYSQEEGAEPHIMIQQKTRRVTPHPSMNPLSQESSQSDDMSSAHTNPGTMVHPRDRSRRSMMKHFSQGSIGGGSVGGTSSIGASSESFSVSSVLETQSNLTCATDILSSLGFDDFDSPQLVPDRFIPKELEHLRPSVMKAAYIEQILSLDPPRSPDSLASGHSSSHTAHTQPRLIEAADLPLGATAENFLAGPPRPSSPVTAAPSSSKSEDDEPRTPGTPSDTMPLFTDTAATVGFSRSRILETVPEETASDLSLSPRWLSPRVSVDHSVIDLAEGKLGASLNQKIRRRSLPTREGYRWSIGSLVESDTGDSIQLSVTSYDDEIAAERERERESLHLGGVHDDITLSLARRRRRGVYTPPQALLSWLSTQKTIDEEASTELNPDDLPWPFNEQAHLRKSLTEISLAQQYSLSDGVGSECNIAPEDSSDGVDMSVSPITTPNTRLSPQPTISEEDADEVDDLKVGLPYISGQSNCYRDNELSANLEDNSGSETVLASLEDDTSNGETKAHVHADPETPITHLSIYQHHQHGAGHLAPSPINKPRQRKQGLTNTFKSPLQRLLDESRPPSPLVVKARPPLPQISVNTESATKLLDLPGNSGSVESTSSLQEACEQKEESSNDPPHNGKCESSPRVDSSRDKREQDSSRDQREQARRPHQGVTSPTVSSHHQLSLKRNSLESLPDSLPVDITEIELLTGDIHSPMMSSRRTRPPLQKQMSVDEDRPSRRVAVFGKAPPPTELFANGTITEDENEVGKLMVL